VWASTTTRVGDAVRLMVHHRVRHLVVVNDEGRPAGVLSVDDLLGWLDR